MTSIDRSVPAAAGTTTRLSNRALLAVFTATLFLSALLLFVVQPMFAKMILPKLGGSPSVWSVAMVFFQGMLLAGYAYAHALTRMLGLSRAALVHLVVLSGALLMQPIAVAQGWNAPPESGQAFWLIGLFGVSVGLPFFAIAGNAPLLQAWFARSGHNHAADPYFLYSASNLGSFGALILYPVLFEPFLTLREQSVAWTVGFIVLAAMIGIAATFALRNGAAAGAVPFAQSHARPDWRQRWIWMGLAFVPSALLVAVTAHIATDIASAPFLWVVPLSLYLLTFIIVFQRRPLIRHDIVLLFLPMLVAPIAVSVMSDRPSSSLWLTVVLHLVFFFVASMACHGELARRRPQAADLTEFYLFISVGGVIGGIFAGLLAPVIFSTVLEYPILIVASLFCLPALYARSWRSNARDALLVAAVVAVLAIPDLLGFSIRYLPMAVYQIALGLAALAIILLRYRPAASIAAVVGAMVLSVLYVGDMAGGESYRSFFGVNKIAEVMSGQYRTLTHGTTLHGAERIRNADGAPYAGRPEPSTYYYPGSPMDEALMVTRGALGNLRVAIVGLGTGSLACHAEPGEDWRFYEIDREVMWIAQNRFRFLSECTPRAPVIIGDARLTLAREPAGRFDVILVDAFSSDAIPVHLLTKEAIAGYIEKLSPHGVLIFHLSNRHMDLRPILANAAAANGLTTVAKRILVDRNAMLRLRTSSSVAAVARSSADLEHLTKTGWTLRRPTTARVWTDDYSNVLGAVLAGWRSSD
jgi:hypothetical protein